MSDAPERIWADDAGGWWRLESDENPGALIEYVRADLHEALRARIAELKGRLCVTCGRVFPKTQSRFASGDGCQEPDLCSIDMTLQEAFEYWRQKAHDAEARVRKMAAEKREAAMQYLADTGQLLDSNATANARVAELEAALQSARNEALEDAAKVVEDYLMDRRLQNLKAKLAVAIRALKDRNETETEREPDNRTDNPDNRLDGEREET